ncbi:hypothetical protein Tco_0998603 [Tanacetum coccineum]
MEESKPTLEVLENYMTYRKKLDEVLMGRARLNSDDYGEEVKMIIMELGLPKKILLICSQFKWRCASFVVHSRVITVYLYCKQGEMVRMDAPIDLTMLCLKKLQKKWKRIGIQNLFGMCFLENYGPYRTKLDEVSLMGNRARLNSDDYGEEVKMIIMELGLPKKICDPGNFVLPVEVNGTIEMNALTDTRASVSVLPYCLFMNLGLGDPKPYNSNLTMADNTQAKAMREVKNVRI